MSFILQVSILNYFLCLSYIFGTVMLEFFVSCRQHMIHIKTAYPKFRKRTKWLQDKHNSTFIQWLRFKVYVVE